MTRFGQDYTAIYLIDGLTDIPTDTWTVTHGHSHTLAQLDIHYMAQVIHKTY